MTRLGDLSRLLASLVLVVGIVPSPLRAMAATIPAFIAYDASIRSTATTALGRHDAVQPETERARIACDDAALASHAPSNRLAAAGVRGVLTFDDALNLAERRELTESAIYAAPAAVTAAKGNGGGLDMGKQGRHIPGNNNYIPGRSTLSADPAKLATKVGTARQIGNVPIGQAGSKEWTLGK